MLDKKLLIALAMIAIVFLAGCTSGQQTTQTSQAQQQNVQSKIPSSLLDNGNLTQAVNDLDQVK